MRYEINIAGSGGQGVMLIATILAQAVASTEGLFITQVQNYDPAVRGGKAESNLVISDEEIDYPGVLRLDVLLALSREGYERNLDKLKSEGLLIVDSECVEELQGNKVLRIPFSKTAQNKFNNVMVANMIALGVLTGFCEYISPDAVKSAISLNFKGKALELNLSAFMEGLQYADRCKECGFEKLYTGGEEEPKV